MVVCVGLILLLNGAVRTAVSIGFLGVAFSWAFGSNYRLVHWLCVAFGLLLFIPAVGDGVVWFRNKPELIKDQMSIIQIDRDVLKNDESISQSETDRQEHRKDQEQVFRDMNNLSKDQVELSLRKSEGVFRHVIRIDWETIVGGTLLLSAGLGLLLGVKPLPK